jgi:hypothetical protein
MGFDVLACCKVDPLNDPSALLYQLKTCLHLDVHGYPWALNTVHPNRRRHILLRPIVGTARLASDAGKARQHLGGRTFLKVRRLGVGCDIPRCFEYAESTGILRVRLHSGTFSRLKCAI